MAADAVVKIKEAEEKGAEIIRLANEQAKEIIQNASKDGLQKRLEIITQANMERIKIIEAAIKSANESCKPLIDEGNKAKGRIKHPDPNALKKATDIVIERIVNARGNS